jgi:hypothetical protein
MVQSKAESPPPGYDHTFAGIMLRFFDKVIDSLSFKLVKTCQ